MPGTADSRSRDPLEQHRGRLVRVARLTWRDRHQQHVPVEPELLRSEIGDGAQQQSGANQEDRAHRQLGNEHDPPGEGSRARAGRADVRGLIDRRHRRRPRRPSAWPEAERDHHRHAGAGERQHARVELERELDRRNHDGKLFERQRGRPAREQQAEEPGHDRQHHAFSRRLPDEAPASHRRAPGE